MLTTFGDMLNWIAAGVFFPLMMLPLASLGKGRGTFLWLSLVAGVVAASTLFAALAADLNPPEWSA